MVCFETVLKFYYNETLNFKIYLWKKLSTGLLYKYVLEITTYGQLFYFSLSKCSNIFLILIKLQTQNN